MDPRASQEILRFGEQLGPISDNLSPEQRNNHRAPIFGYPRGYHIDAISVPF